jgi:hypothetical protein
VAVSVYFLLKDLVDLVNEVHQSCQLTDQYIYFRELDQLWMIRNQKFFFEIRILEFEGDFVLLVRLSHLLQKLMKAYRSFQIRPFVAAESRYIY